MAQIIFLWSDGCGDGQLRCTTCGVEFESPPWWVENPVFIRLLGGFHAYFSDSCFFITMGGCSCALWARNNHKFIFNMNFNSCTSTSINVGALAQQAHLNSVPNVQNLALKPFKSSDNQVHFWNFVVNYFFFRPQKFFLWIIKKSVVFSE